MSMSTPIGTVTYNGVTMPGPVNYRARVRNVMTADNRCAKYQKVTLTAEMILAPEYFSGNNGTTSLGGSEDGTLDVVMGNLRNRLMEPAKALTFSGVGFGTVLLSPGSAALPVAFGNADPDNGPHPLEMEWIQFGGNRAAKFLWTIEFSQLTCDSPSEYGFVGEVTFEVSWSVDRYGMSTRTVSGSVEVLAGRSGTNRAYRSADQYWETYAPKTLARFHRQTSRTLSRDRKTINFVTTDSEIASDNAYPALCVDFSLRHEVESKLSVVSGGATLWGGSISGSATVKAGHSKMVALQGIKALINGLMPTTGGAEKNANSLIIRYLKFGENKFDRTLDFAFAYTFTCRLSDLLSASKVLHRPNLQNDWAQWRASLDSGGFQPYGYANLRFDVNRDDLISCFCSNATPGGSQTVTTPNTSDGNDEPFEEPYESGDDGGYLHYQCKVEIERVTDTIYHQPTRGGNESSGDSEYETIVDDTGNNITIRVEADRTGSNPTAYSSVQDRGNSYRLLHLSGYGIRAGNHVPIPKLTLGGNDGAIHWEHIEASHIVGADALGQPLYRATWNRIYYMTSDEARIQIDGVPEGYKPEFGS